MDERLDPKVKLERLNLPLDGNAPCFWASYQAYTAVITIHISHLMASIGSIKMMKWIRDNYGQEILDSPATQVPKSNPNGTAETTYTPLMSALFMSQTEAAIWLLNHGASPTVTNADGLTPFHLLASIGLPGESAEARIEALTKIACKLMDKSADLNVRCGSLRHRDDPEALRIKNRTALELAAGANTAYPKQALHLLATSFHRPEQGSLFREVNFVAMQNPIAADLLLQKMQERHLGAVKRQLRHEVIDEVEDGNQHMQMFIRILKKSPNAGVRLLELLMMEPLVSNPRRYPLPLYTELPNGLMATTYQPGNDQKRPEWEQKDPVPSWHRLFKKDLPADPLLHTNVYEVQIRALHLPGILNIQVLSTLSMVRHATTQLKIFGNVSVMAINVHMWEKCSPLHTFTVMTELLLLCCLIGIGIYPPPANMVLPRLVIESVLHANIMQDALHVVYGTIRCRQKVGLPGLKHVWWFESGHILRMVFLVFLLHANIPVETGVMKVLLATNIMIRCISIMSLLRTVASLGQLIIAVLHSFAPMKGMFIFMGIVFTTFSLVFLSFKDPERTDGFVVLYLYEALFLGDEEAAQTISGIDVAHQQTLDIGQEMFIGDDNEWILSFSVFVTILSTSIYSLVLLNLMVGMYTNYYDQMEPLAPLLFQQQRSKWALVTMLRPAWTIATKVRSDQRASWEALLLLTTASLLLYLFVILIEGPAALAALLLLALSQFYQAVLLYEVSKIDNSNDFLWVSYRTDFDEVVGQNTEQGELRQLRRDLQEARLSHSSELVEVRKELNKLAKELANILANV